MMEALFVLMLIAGSVLLLGLMGLAWGTESRDGFTDLGIPPLRDRPY
jgi:hypothetical protein